MLKLIKSIVNENRNLIGFVLEGKDKELEGFSDSKVRKPMPINVLKAKNFSNHQVDIRETGITTKDNFKIHDLDMAVWVNNSFVDIDNTINLTQKFVQNNEIVGFTVKFSDNSVANYTYPNIIQLATWFKPGNFVVRKLSADKVFIVGKPGVLKLEDLPEHIIKPKSTLKPKKQVNKVNEVDKDTKVNVENKGVDVKNTEISGKLNNELDIVDMYTLLNEYNGLVIRLPYEKYIKTTKSYEKTDSNFHPLGLGEYAYPTFGVNDSKLNFNTDFIKPGTVKVELEEGKETLIPSFTYNRKSIFINTDKYLKRFGIAIPKDKEAQFINYFGSSLSLKPLENEQFTKALEYLTGKEDLLFYEVRTSNIDLIAPKNYNKHILSAKEIRDILDDTYVPKLIYKYTNPMTGLVAELKRKHKIDYKAIEGKKPIGVFAKMDEETRTKIAKAQIDLYSGAFLGRVKIDEEEQDRDKSVTTSVKNKEVTIEYMLEGKDINKWTYSKIRNAGLEGENLPEEVIKIIQYIESLYSVEDKIKLCLSLRSKAETKIELARKKLWAHKCAMYLKYDGKIHQGDRHKWEMNTTKKTKATFYNCIEPGCEGLMVAMLNTRII